MKAFRRVTVATQLPEELEGLRRLALNLRWAWHEPTRQLFERVDPELYRSVNGDPLALIRSLRAEQVLALAADGEFRASLDAAAADLEAYLEAPSWYSTHVSGPESIAYLSPEFGITESLPQYSGGLGILAGDHLKSASDLGVPLVAVGLLYRGGYFRQSLAADGWQMEGYPVVEPELLATSPLTDHSGDQVLIAVPVSDDRTLWAKIWVAQVGRVPLLLLDSDVQGNSEMDRAVTDRLYGGGTDHRLAQEILLGIGGVRAVRAYSAVTGRPAPTVFHSNEGHAGFQAIERLRETVAAGYDYDTALAQVRASTVFTTHTVVPAGIDRFPRDMVREVFLPGHLAPGLDVERLLTLGAEPDGGDPGVFNMAMLGMRVARRSNGVSALHGAVSRDLFGALWPGLTLDEVPIRHVTNGVHQDTWVAPALVDLVGGRAAHGSAADTWRAFASVSDQSLWSARCELRAGLVAEVRRRVAASWRERGGLADELGWVSQVFDPRVLTVGFARRVPSYKRLTLMLRDPERLVALLTDPARPVQFVIAGKAHPADDGGKELIRQMVQFADRHDVRHRIVFLPDYDIGMARHMYAGCDVWLNNPLRPFEACGTSGMKSALNGGLNLSVRDGWWDELYDGVNGWVIPSVDGARSVDHRDNVEAAGLYDLLENEVRPLFYERDDRGVPVGWIERLRHTLVDLGPKVLADRMVEDYVRQFYLPAAEDAAQLAADDGQFARALSSELAQVAGAWPHVRIVDVVDQVDGHGGLGSALDVVVTVDARGLDADQVQADAFAGGLDEHDMLVRPVAIPLKAEPGHDGLLRFAGPIPLSLSGQFGYTVRVLPRCVLTEHVTGLAGLFAH